MLRKREPTSPGEILREEFLKPLGLTQRQVADHLDYEVKVINRIVGTGSDPADALPASGLERGDVVATSDAVRA